MSSVALGRLERVSLREAWASEPYGFTPWLAQEENLQLLGDAIGLELELESQEKAVGRFSADILCKDTSNDSWVLIENQLERTDHTHLGQLLTYAAGLNAVTIVWIAQRFTEEHRAALDWLNERTDESVRFFGLEIELWRIGTSPMAPKFNIISKPNDWSKSVQQEVAKKGELSELKQLQIRFWTEFREYMEENGSFIKCNNPSPLHWTSHSLGRAGVKLISVMATRGIEKGDTDPRIGVEVYIDSPNAKQYFGELLSQKDAIEAALGFSMNWFNSEEKTTCKIHIKQKADVTNPALWPEQFEWLRSKLEAIHRVFAPIVKTLGAGA